MGIEGFPYCVGIGGVQVRAHDALFLDLAEEGFGERVGERS